jgi:Spy/CpxP family protein refolding chaperone
MVARPVHLGSVRWWQSPAVAQAIQLTTAQRDVIDRIYQQRLTGRRRCVERLVEASNRVDELIRAGVYDDIVLKQTQAAAGAAAEERTVTHALSEEISAILSPDQRAQLITILAGRIVE